MSKTFPSRRLVLLGALLFLLFFWFFLSRLNVKLCPALPEGSFSLSRGQNLFSASRLLSEREIYAEDHLVSDTAESRIVKKLSGKLLLPSALFDTAPEELPELYVPGTQSCVMVVNGRVFTAPADGESLRCSLADLLEPDSIIGKDTVPFSVDLYYLYGNSPSFSNGLLYLGSAGRISSLISAGSFQRFFVIGISFMILLYSLSLYSCKTSEKYLLYLALLAYTTSARTLWNTLPALKQLPLLNLLLFGTIPLPGVSVSVSYYVSYLVLKLILAFMRYLLLREFIPVRIGRLPYFWATLFLFVVALPFCFAGHGYLASQAFILLCHLVELIFLTLGSREHFRTCLTLTIVWCFTVALRVLDLFYTCGWAPHGIIEASLKLQGIIETFFTLGFVIVINLKFAGKYREADDLRISLAEVNRNLERIVAERTEDLRLRNEELSAAYHHMNEIQQQKDEFMTNIIHNLKTPLFSLYGYADMAMDEMVDSPELARRHLNEINKNTAYAKELIDNLFLCMRLEDGKVQYQPMPFSVAMLLAQLESTTRARTETAGISLSVLAPEEELILTSDILYLRQALQNIIDNAVRHSAAGTSLLIQAGKQQRQFESDPTERPWVCIRIQDQGEGISPEDIPLIFGRYYSGGKKGASSSGLGLTITKEIITQNGGHIEVDSVVNQGTVFRVYLPLN